MTTILPVVITSIRDNKSDDNFPEHIYLYQNYPNPFNPETTIKFSLPSGDYVSLKVYNILGKLVAVLLNEYKKEGIYSLNFNSEDYNLSSGVYFYRLEAGNYSVTRKLLLLK